MTCSDDNKERNHDLEDCLVRMQRNFIIAGAELRIFIQYSVRAMKRYLRNHGKERKKLPTIVFHFGVNFGRARGRNVIFERDCRRGVLCEITVFIDEVSFILSGDAGQGGDLGIFQFSRRRRVLVNSKRRLRRDNLTLFFYASYGVFKSGGFFRRAGNNRQRGSQALRMVVRFFFRQGTPGNSCDCGNA